MLDVNHNKYKKVFILTAGPSVKNYIYFIDKITDPEIFVVCVKQTILLSNIKKHCDLLFVNNFNLIDYRKFKTYKVYGNSNLNLPSFQKWDESFEFTSEPSSLKNSIISKNNWEYILRFQQDQKLEFGPGILIELVIPYLISVGFKEIEILGWDIADSKGRNIHFYDKETSSLKNKIFHKFLLLFNNSRSLIIIINWIKFILRRKYYPAGMEPNEANLVRKNRFKLLKYLKKHGVDIKLI